MQHKLFFIPIIVLLCSIIVGTRMPWHFPRWPLKNLKKIPKILDIVKEIRDSSVNDVECCGKVCFVENPNSKQNHMTLKNVCGTF